MAVEKEEKWTLEGGISVSLAYENVVACIISRRNAQTPVKVLDRPAGVVCEG